MRSVSLKFLFFRNYWWVLGFLILAVLLYFAQTEKPLTVAAPIVGTLLSVLYFVQKQKLEELKVFRDIFRECNERYDALNERLSLIGDSRDDSLTSEQQQLLVDYFNLCGEEYLYYQRGMIDPDVWRSWSNGMKTILKAKQVKKFWDEEKKTNSYYGLERHLEN